MPGDPAPKQSVPLPAMQLEIHISPDHELDQHVDAVIATSKLLTHEAEHLKACLERRREAVAAKAKQMITEGGDDDASTSPVR